MKIGIVYGGYSSERKASAENAGYIDKTLRQLGYETVMIPYGQNLVGRLRAEDIQLVYVCVQGKGHGDGTVQAVLEQERIPFTGSGSHAAAVINDKILSKLLFAHYGIPTPAWEILTAEAYEKGEFHPETFGYPFVAKAPSEGGSFGIELIQDSSELGKLEKVFAYESPILIEEFIPGSFYTIGILEQEGKLCLLPCVEGVEIQEGREKDDPDSLKVFTGEYGVREAHLPQKTLSHMAEMAKKIFSVTGARGVARIDFMVSKEELAPYVLEINAVPGLKPRSLLPGEAKLAGMPYPELIEGILLSAQRKREEERA